MFRPVQDAQLSLNNLQDEMNQMLSRFWHAGVSTGPLDGQAWAPLIDLYEFEDRYAIHAEVPGIDGDTVELSFLNGALTIRGEKNPPSDAEDSDRSLRGEVRYGAFCRTIELPGDVEADNISAKCQNGVLVITIPKTESQRPKEIKIDVQGD